MCEIVKYRGKKKEREREIICQEVYRRYHSFFRKDGKSFGEKTTTTTWFQMKRGNIYNLKPKSGCTELVWINLTLSCLKEILGPRAQIIKLTTWDTTQEMLQVVAVTSRDKYYQHPSSCFSLSGERCPLFTAYYLHWLLHTLRYFLCCNHLHRKEVPMALLLACGFHSHS